LCKAPTISMAQSSAYFYGRKQARMEGSQWIA
jgi:hypothetical protein